ncbi:protein-L-isoaspartate(D-aspartate) O-methyltransferase [Magnetococcus sp. PR-3]|uniref:protein-L-isoaspartate(D-aspartate) O-methyltransferase n=1 Tax=Magnetococcus sp. PR-3 TaxID=3120355 RepID=UPI002FCDE5B0
MAPTPLEKMVQEQIQARGVSDPRVLAAMQQIPREQFIPQNIQHHAFADRPLPIGHGQTISQPYIVAYMCDKLDIDVSHRVLEIGTGCGYHGAVLSKLASQVYSIEILEPLALQAKQTTLELALTHLTIHTGDGQLGWPEQAPFDRISVAAATPTLPQAWIDQLAEGGKMIVPMGNPHHHQTLMLYEKIQGHLQAHPLLPVSFVPLTSSQTHHTL